MPVILRATYGRFRPLLKNPLGHLAGLAMLLPLASCGIGTQASSELDGVRDNTFATYFENTFLDRESQHPVIKGPSLPYILMTDKNDIAKKKAYAIDCRGLAPKQIADVFGFDVKSPAYSDWSYADLQKKYDIDSQPILRCTGLNPTQTANQQIGAVFQLVKDVENISDEKLKAVVANAPDLYVRFNRLKPEDQSFNDEEFYSVGCRNFLDAFGTPQQKTLQAAIPLLASTISEVFPEFFQQYKPLNCPNTAQDPLLGKPSMTLNDIPERKNDNITDNSMKFIKVLRADDDSLIAAYMVQKGDRYTRIDCPNISDRELRNTFGFPDSMPNVEMKSDNPIFLAASRNARLECPSAENLEKFEKVFVPTRELPSQKFYKLRGQNHLYQFACSNLETYFTKNLDIEREHRNISVSRSMLNYLVDSGRYKLDVFPCFGKSRMTVDEVKEEIRLAFAREAFQVELDRWIPECAKFDGNCSREIMRQSLVETTKQDRNWILGVIIAAYQGANGLPGALGRAPYPEEVNYFMQQAETNGTHRPHYQEIRDFVKGAKQFPRDLLAQRTKIYLGVELVANLLNRYTTTQLNKPELQFQAIDFDNYLREGYSYDNAIRTMARRAHFALGDSAPNMQQLDALLNHTKQEWVKVGYENILGYLRGKSTECVTIQGNEPQKFFQFLRKHTRVSKITGQWTWSPSSITVNEWGDSQKVKDTINPGDNLGALLLSVRDDDSGKPEKWAAWTGSKNFKPREHIWLTMNDVLTAFHDNGGFLEVCVE